MDSHSYILAQLHSVEGTGHDEWPPSPALQSCSLQEIRPGQTAAFLVGMAGQSHWSASIEAVPHEGAFVFDFACRVHQAPQWLGTTYELSFSPPYELVRFKVTSDGIDIQIYGLFQGILEDFTNFSGKLLQLPCAQRPAKLPATLRWRYRIYLAEPSMLPDES